MKRITQDELNAATIASLMEYRGEAGRKSNSLYIFPTLRREYIDSFVSFYFQGGGQYLCSLDFGSHARVLDLNLGYQSKEVYAYLQGVLGEDYIDKAERAGKRAIISTERLDPDQTRRLVWFIAEKLCATRKRGAHLYHLMTGRSFKADMVSFLRGMLDINSSAGGGIGLSSHDTSNIALTLALNHPTISFKPVGDWTLVLPLLESDEHVQRIGNAVYLHPDITLYEFISVDRGWGFRFQSESHRGALILSLLVR